MIDKNKLNELYDLVIENKELTTKNLNNIGFSSYDITKLIEQKVLKRVKRGNYQFLRTEDLIKYGRKLNWDKDYEKARLCFKKCYELNSKNGTTCFQLFLASITNKNYEESFTYLDVLLSTENKNYLIDTNVYIYLLNNITELPTKYKEYANNLKLEDLKISYSDKRYHEIDIQNNIRELIYKKKFKMSLNKLRDLYLSNKKLITEQYIMIKTLLAQTVEVYKRKQKELKDLINKKDYINAKEYLIKESKNNDLKIKESYTLILIDHILNIKNNNVIPQTKNIYSGNLYNAIDLGNFELALKISNEYNAKNNLNNSDDILNLLLVDLCDLIKEKNNIVEESKEIETKNYTIFDIMKYIINNDIDNANISIKEYMKSINKSEYEYLIIDLFKLSIIEQDREYTKPLNTLTDIVNDNYKINISMFIKEFYNNLYNNKIELCNIYLDIILKSNILKENELKQLYNDLDNIKNNKEILDEDKKYIDNIHKIVTDIKEVVIINNINDIKEEKYKNIIENYNDITSFKIKDDNKESLVIRYVNNNEEIDSKNISMEADTLYKNHDYQNSLKLYLKLLSTKKEPYALVYVRIGLCYLKLKQNKKAIDYLTIANYLNKKYGKKYDYTDLISNLKNNTKKEDRKKYVKMDENEFESNDSIYQTINNFSEINDYILNSNLSVEEACKNLGYDEEKINIIKLIYAVEYYKNNNDIKGNEFLLDVENSKNKSKNIIKLCKNIRNNKKFYKNRNADSNVLSLTLKPKK